MADVITRFKLETTQYDSKLRDEAKRLAEFTRQCSMAGNEFGKFAQKNVEAARALGSFTPSATNAKDKVKELVGAFNDAAKAYNSLTKEQQQSDFGKAMAESIGQLNVKIREAKQELYGMGDAIKKAGGGGLFSGMGDKMSGAIQVFAGNMLTKAAGAAASLTSEMYGMVQQGIELAKQGEGIRIAFERLGRGDILDGLRQATHGTVTDLELMKAAVKFNDFKLPVEELGILLQFAQQKAKDTGQSVDYMVDSIVTGLGRKSLMILDNLGLSATEVKEKMAETGDMTKAVGAIIREQMAKAGDYVETAADRAAQANVSLQNKMEELGRKFAPVEEASTQLWTSMKIGILDIIGGPLATLLNQLTEAGRLKNMLNDMNGEPGSGNTKVDQQLKKLNVIKKGGGSDYIFNSTLNGMMEDYNRQIMALDAQIKNGGKRPGAGSGESQDVRYLQQKMDALKIMRDQLAAGAKELSKPVDVKIETKGAEQNVESLKVNTTHTLTKPEKADEAYKKAQQDYQQALAQAALEVKAGTINSADAKKRELQASESLWKSIGDARETYDSPKLKDAQAKVEQDIIRLGGEVTKAVEAQKRSEQAARELEQAQKKLADAQSRLAEAQKSGNLKDIYAAEKNVTTAQNEVTRLETIKVNVVPGTVELPDVPKEQEVKIVANTDNISAQIAHLKENLGGLEIGSLDFNMTQANLVDMTTLQTLVNEQMKAGLKIDPATTQELMNQIVKGFDIDDSTWQELVDKINEKLKELNIAPIKINFETGKSETRAQESMARDLSKFTGYAEKTLGGVSSIVGGLSQLGVEIPKGLQDVLGGIQGVISITTTIASIVAMIEALNAVQTTESTIKSIPFFGWMLAGGGIVHAANGYVPGNNYSGDQVPALLNSGELVLNKAQQNALANELQGGGMQNMRLQTEVRGRSLIFVLDNELKAQGKGQLATFK